MDRLKTFTLVVGGYYVLSGSQFAALVLGLCLWVIASWRIYLEWLEYKKQKQ